MTTVSLKGIIAVIGESELSQKDRDDYHLAQKLIKYFAQSMFVTQDLNGSPGEYVSKEDNLTDQKVSVLAGA